MGNRDQLPHLIKLLDDESGIVREQIVAELVSFGPALEHELKRQNIILNPTQQQLILDILNTNSRHWLTEHWERWFAVRDDKLKLEIALGLIAQFLHGSHSPVNLDITLDRLCKEYQLGHAESNAQLLAHFLFTTKQLKGADQSDYYNPMHSSLIHVIDHKRGIPISLACVYILVGHRLGLDIEGCNFPGHFLALAFTKHQKHIVDCYNRGTFLSEQDFLNLTKSTSIKMKDIFQLECDATTIIMRVLRNLINSYQKLHQQANVEFISELIGKIEAEDGGEEGN